MAPYEFSIQGFTDSSATLEAWLNIKESSFAVHVATDAMREAGIHHGDYVIINRGKVPRIGDIVIAQVDDAYVIRYYQISQGKPYVVPANGPYDILEPHHTLTVIGVVTAVIRKYAA